MAPWELLGTGMKYLFAMQAKAASKKLSAAKKAGTGKPSEATAAHISGLEKAHGDAVAERDAAFNEQRSKLQTLQEQTPDHELIAALSDPSRIQRLIDAHKFPDKHLRAPAAELRAAADESQAVLQSVADHRQAAVADATLQAEQFAKLEAAHGAVSKNAPHSAEEDLARKRMEEAELASEQAEELLAAAQAEWQAVVSMANQVDGFVIKVSGAGTVQVRVPSDFVLRQSRPDCV